MIIELLLRGVTIIANITELPAEPRRGDTIIQGETFIARIKSGFKFIAPFPILQ